MANALTTGAWLSAPTKKPSFFARLLRAHIEARQRGLNARLSITLPSTGSNGRMTQNVRSSVSS